MLRAETKRLWHVANRNKASVYRKTYIAKHRKRFLRRKRCLAMRAKYGQDIHARVVGMMGEQCGLCAICDELTKLSVDHCHMTGKVVAMLCSTCNSAIGLLKEDPFILRKAAEYVLLYK